MKKAFLNFADRLLSKEQMKNVTGGDWWDDYQAELARQQQQADLASRGDGSYNTQNNGGGADCLQWYLKTTYTPNGGTIEQWVAVKCGTSYH